MDIDALEDRFYRTIVSRFEGMGEAWTTDESGDTLARAAAEVAAREVASLLDAQRRQIVQAVEIAYMTRPTAGADAIGIVRSIPDV